ncbi:CDPK-related kinase 8 [Prunus dulcis]|uniref:CDPK-related kinase 8 n=1 Tax=Prunus dulcis TaxID=3755 RepID=A0A4Y1RF17_PRUDU|nr:CDPK-related kinase 8 [Prunus dulcis]
MFDEDSQLKAIDFGLSDFVKLGWSSKRLRNTGFDTGHTMPAPDTAPNCSFHAFFLEYTKMFRTNYIAVLGNGVSPRWLAGGGSPMVLAGGRRSVFEMFVKLLLVKHSLLAGTKSIGLTRVLMVQRQALNDGLLDRYFKVSIEGDSKLLIGCISVHVLYHGDF